MQLFNLMHQCIYSLLRGDLSPQFEFVCYVFTPKSVPRLPQTKMSQYPEGLNYSAMCVPCSMSCSTPHIPLCAPCRVHCEFQL